MPKNFSDVEIEYLRRQAKDLKRSAAIPLYEAQDRVAKNNGWANWSLLHKHGVHAPEASGRRPFLFTRSDEEMRKALRKVPEPGWLVKKRRYELAREMVEVIDEKFISAANAIDFAISYMETLLRAPRFLVSSSSPVYWEMRHWLPYSALEVGDEQRILVNRHYKLVGQTSDEWAVYEDHPHLHLTVTEQQTTAWKPYGSRPGFFYNDGCPPWGSRRFAEDYLLNLREAKKVLAH
ncbi:hypothetical protein [Variovorax sp. JS1663]|uniref:hypothetical protein n=1 Tax=Variovorax sp. JS1663 TaxID=1851577 RepID=UPI000B341044|nr:hypothetical protein [Variovorax sp. JS1663]OUM00046.1 hypothetical protein A8M77_22950 [Variovorax sp. JS1663]